MQSLTDTTLVLGSDASLDHVVSHPVQPAIVPMQSSADTTHVFGSDASLDQVVSHPIQPTVEEVVMSMQSSIDPTLLLKSDKSKEMTLSMQSSTNPTLLSGGDASFNHVLSISSFVPSEQESILLSSSALPLSPRMVLFDWNDLVESRLLSFAPFQIMGERSSISILSSSAWQALGSPKLVSVASELLAFDRSTAWEPWSAP
jgi:hypothetical protein